jgi:hypothetical protein
LICAFKHVDTLGAYSIPSETGLLISSGFVSDACAAHLGCCLDQIPN